MAGLDREQRRAFEIFASAFVLTFYNDPEAQQEMDREDDRSYQRELLRLNKLAGRIKTCRTQQSAAVLKAKNLICLLHGAGGSGKSA